MTIDFATSQASIRKFIEEPHRDPVTGEKLRLVIDANENGQKCLKWRPLGIGEKILCFFGQGNGCFKNVVEFALANNILADSNKQELRNRLYTQISTYNQEHSRGLRTLFRVNVKSLLQPKETAMQAVAKAIESKDPVRAKFLLEIGDLKLDADPADVTHIANAMRKATKEGYVDLLKAMVKLDPSLRIAFIKTAVEYGKKDCLDVLITNMGEYAYNTSIDVIFLALDKYNPEVFGALLGITGIKVIWRNKEGDTPFHVAIRSDNMPALKQLLQHKDPNARNKNLNTPLHTAALNGNIEAARLLLDHPEFKRNEKNKDLYTALDLALRNHPANKKLIQLLEQKGCIKAKDVTDPQ